MSSVVYKTPFGYVQEFTADLSQVAGTYDLCTASGDLLVQAIGLYVATAGAVFTSVTIQSNQTTPFVVLNAADGAVANLVAQKSLASSWSQVFPWSLRSAQKVQYTIAGAQGSGSLKVPILYTPITGGGSLS
jgi:hypothetical protein